MQPTRTDKQERAMLRSGIMVATRNPAVVGKVAKSFHAPSAILDPHFEKMGIAKAESGSGPIKASGRGSRVSSGDTRRSPANDERIQPVGESTRSCILNKEAING